MISNIGNPKKDNNNNLVIKPSELKKKMDNGDDFLILDVRTKQEHDMWSMSYDKYKDSTLIPIDTLMLNESLKKLPKDKEIIAFCAHGQRSSFAASALSSLGYNVRTVEGGLAEWSNVYDVVPIEINESIPLRIWQIRRISKGCMSYVIASARDKSAIILDPTCGVESIIDNLRTDYQLTIKRVIDTHMHADHLSGSTKIAYKYNAELNISSVENYSMENIPQEYQSKIIRISDDDKIILGDGLYLTAIHTPGHTDGSISYALDVDSNSPQNTVSSNGDIQTSSHSCFLFTGDTIFVNGVGRPDLHNKAQEYTSKLYHTYKNKIFSLPDNTIVLPSHYSESFEHDKPIFNTLQSIKQKLLDITHSENSFTNYIASNIPAQPMNYGRIVKLNKSLISCEKVFYNDLEAGPNSCGIKT